MGPRQTLLVSPRYIMYIRYVHNVYKIYIIYKNCSTVEQASTLRGTAKSTFHLLKVFCYISIWGRHETKISYKEYNCGCYAKENRKRLIQILCNHAYLLFVHPADISTYILSFPHTSTHKFFQADALNTIL